ncbi:MAG: translocation/assembly module TamB domain-containing protein [Spirochaetaceae bacterium]|nr:translocation/assembly module TamB domain-containing protein [Spirochaetaceae bacterium]
MSFFYPNTQSPFIQATITENQKIMLTYDHIANDFAINGNLSFRSGEFYYFQKNFFITEGSLSLRTDALSGQNTIQPTINLRAKLTDFDAQGNRVDIFLILQDSSLTNLNPRFESTPPKDVNEILEILGQSILPTGAYGQVNLYSVASLAAAATDVAERLGYLQTSQTSLLTDSIRISLGLDMFSIRSNILQNILIDALPGASLANLSPLARYLNNTTIFMGKYVGEQFFLQALVHLTAIDGTEATRTFIYPDLSLDLELSLDWQNPIGTFSFFTQPNELSFVNILDTIGFSVTRRFVLR